MREKNAWYISVLIILLILGSEQSRAQLYPKIIIPDGPCLLTVPPDALEFGPQGNTQNISVDVGPRCFISVTDNRSWITSSFNGTTNTIIITVSENTGGVRSGVVTVENFDIIILQEEYPSTPSSISVSNQCGKSVLTRGTPPSGITWYWQGKSSNGTGTSNSSTTYNATSDGTYYLRARDNSTGAWSISSRSVSVNVKERPGTPSSISVSNQCGKSVLTRGTPPPGITWYWHTSSTGTSTSNSSVTYTTTSSRTYYLRARNNTTGCWSISNSTATTAVKPIPSTPAGLGDFRCGAGVVHLMAQEGADAKEVSWFDDNNYHLATGNEYSPSVTTTTDYKVKARNTIGCYSDPVTVTATVNPLPGNPVSIVGNEVCGSGEVTLSAQPGSGASEVMWFTTADNYIKTGTSYTKNINSTESYVAKSRNTTTGCLSTGSTVTATSNPIPADPVAIVEGSVCGSGEVTLSAQPGSGGDNVTWYNNSGLHQTTNTIFTTSIPSTTSFTAKSIDENTGCESQGVTVNATAHYIPSDPVITNGARCGEGQVTLLAEPELVGNEVNWYSTTGDLISSGLNLTVDITASGNYIAKTKSIASVCESTGDTATATINPIPDLPEVFDDSICGPGEVSLSANPGNYGNQIKWYNAVDEYIMTTDSTYNEILSNTRHYIARSYNANTGCTGVDGAEVKGIIHTVPSRPVSLIDDERCGPGEVNLSAQPGANGNQISWYNANGDLLDITDSEYNPTISADTYITVKTHNSTTGCNSLGNTIQAVFKPVPENPQSIVKDVFCSDNQLIISAEPGDGADNIIWYDSNNNELATDTYYSYSILEAEPTITLKSLNSETQCLSSGITENTLAGAAPDVPVVDSSVYTLDNPGDVTLSASPSNASYQVKWYTEDGQYIKTGESYTPNVYNDRVYKVSTFNPETGCESAKQKIAVNITNMFNFVLNDTKSNELNYIRKIVPKVPIQHIDELKLLSADDVIEQINYIDGLGRKVQTQVGGTGDVGDYLIQFYSYDKFGRTDTSYLPFTSKTEGKYLENTKQDLQSYYSEADAYDDIATSNAPWATVEYEESPYSRVLESSSVGDQWQIKTDTSYTKKAAYETNLTTDSVIKWVPSGNVYVKETYYGEGELYKNISTDENGITAISYINKGGQLILKEQEGLKTYYIYDYFGRVRHVLPPELVENLASISYTIDTNKTLVKQLCYTYVYGERSLLVEKHLPGIEKIEYVYDKVNRPILSRNGNLRKNNQWSFVKYDSYGRMAYSGIWTDAGEPLVGRDNELILDSLGNTIITYSSREELQAQFNSAPDLYETYSITTNEYSSDVFPQQNTDVHVLNVYDKYPTNTTKIFLDEQMVEDPEYDVNANGSLTYTKVKVLDGTNTYLETVVYYDKFGRVIQKHSDNIYGMIDIVNMKYNFMGQVTEQIVDHQMPDANSEVVSKYYNYDQAGRLKSIEQEIDADANGRVKMVEMEYNKLGQVTAKKLHETATNGFLQTIDYDYNIRGWLTSINDVNDNTSGDLFAMKMYYDQAIKSEAQTRNNGMISGIEWKIYNSNIDTITRAYAYTYDKHYRLINADYFDAVGVENYDVSYNYTANGKISSLERYGKTDTDQYGLIDDLTYTYSGNQLTKVDDAGLRGETTGLPNNFPDLETTEQTEYLYDENGNMYVDKNKGLQKITYNHLNLPDTVRFNSDNYIIFTYDALGNKLEKFIVEDNDGGTLYTLVGGFTYRNDTLVQIATEEGMVQITNEQTYDYQYFLKDHLGSTRVVFSDDSTGNNAEILQETHYYPFGMTIDGLSYSNNTENSELFSGKEYTSRLNLNWYDFGARNYDPSLGMWFNVDPLAELELSRTPYNYVANNPVNYTDPDGMRKVPSWHGRGTGVNQIAANWANRAWNLGGNDWGNAMSSYLNSLGTGNDNFADHLFQNRADYYLSGEAEADAAYRRQALDNAYESSSLDISNRDFVDAVNRGDLVVYDLYEMWTAYKNNSGNWVLSHKMFDYWLPRNFSAQSGGYFPGMPPPDPELPSQKAWEELNKKSSNPYDPSNFATYEEYEQAINNTPEQQRIRTEYVTIMTEQELQWQRQQMYIDAGGALFEIVSGAAAIIFGYPVNTNFIDSEYLLPTYPNYNTDPPML